MSFLQYLQEQSRVGKDQRDAILCLVSSHMKNLSMKGFSWQTKLENVTLMVLFKGNELFELKSIILKGKLYTHLTDIDGNILLFICSVAES